MSIYILQKQLKNLTRLLSPNKVVVIYGPRRCGKTTLLKRFLDGIREEYLFVSGEDLPVQNFLGSQSISKLKDFVGKNRLLVIDEAQRIEKIGLNLKLVVDHIDGIKVIATGSSSFDLSKDVGEPLTGRKFVLKLFPLAQMEISSIEETFETEANIEARLIYGSYPEIVTTNDNKQRELCLREIVSSYLYKDVLELDGIRHSNKLIKLLRLLAFQVGKEVSFSELGTQLGMSKNTVERYLDLLEKVFVLYKLSGFSRNLRKEVSKNHRYYFYDNGIRNTIIGNLNPLEIRDDTGMLWENYIIMERVKKQEYLQILSNNYFWRTYDRKEIDLVEEGGGILNGYEIKWRKTKAKPPNDWLSTYKNAKYKVITRENYLEFIK
jgi:hypothetical protein